MSEVDKKNEQAPEEAPLEHMNIVGHLKLHRQQVERFCIEGYKSSASEEDQKKFMELAALEPRVVSTLNAEKEDEFMTFLFVKPQEGALPADEFPLAELLEEE